MNVAIKTSVQIADTTRIKQLRSAFEVPVSKKLSFVHEAELDIDDNDWKIGLIVGPSGAGKSLIARQLFGDRVDSTIQWSLDRAVVDDFDDALTIDEITGACSAVGFNTIPSWMKPHRVLSNGERFRVDLARRLLECESPVVIDEFTSVVDRQVAQCASHAIQKYVRRSTKQFVAVTCHRDVIDWLRPDWVYDPSCKTFARGSIQQNRPPIDITISPVAHSAWSMFAPFHYMSASLHKAARCWGLWVGDALVSFAGVVSRPCSNRKRSDVKGISRVVTLPDFQGLGLAFVLMDFLGSLYTGVGFKFNMYPAHPSLIRAMDRSGKWSLESKSGTFCARVGSKKHHANIKMVNFFGGRSNAVFTYAGPKMDRSEAIMLLSYWPSAGASKVSRELRKRKADRTNVGSAKQPA